MYQPSVYNINKGVNQSIEFFGLRAQYIWYLGASILAILVLYGIIYGALGFSTVLSLIIIVPLGAFCFFYIYRLNDKYGEHGLMKKGAQRRMPDAVNCKTRSVFINLTDPD